VTPRPRRFDKLANLQPPAQLTRAELRTLGRAAVELEDENSGLRAASDRLKASLQVRDPRVYTRGNGHSYICDQATVMLNRGDADGGVEAAKRRLAQHDLELSTDLPARLEERAREARHATESALTGGLAELRAFEQFSGAGGKVFMAKTKSMAAELRALTRGDGAGGFFVPPEWITDEYIPYALAGRPFANLFTNLPLPDGTDSINIPRVTLGLGTGAQFSDNAPVASRDWQDSAAQGLVRTIAGQIDLPLQWLDQRPDDADAILLPQLLADYNTQLNGELLVGNSAYGHLGAIMPAGVIGAANLINLTNTNAAASQQWAFGGTSIAGSPHYASAQMMSILARLRAQNGTAWVANPLVWATMCEAADQQSRPLVPPGASGKYLHGLPIVDDPGVPASFAASGAQPSIGAVTAGQVAPTAGSGTFTPVLLGKWADCMLWEGEYKLMVYREALAGDLMARVQLRNYVASIPNRYVWGGANTTFSGTNQGGGINQGGAVSYAALTQMVSNSVLASGLGF
jgi:HK97 family phage major capsid protein